jgi:hypothetical protein
MHVRSIAGCSLLVLHLLLPSSAMGAGVKMPISEFLTACKKAYPGMHFEFAERCQYMLDICPPENFPACMEPIQRATERVAQCLLKELPPVKTDAAAQQITRMCNDSVKNYDFSFPRLPREKSWKDPASADDCIKRFSKNAIAEASVRGIVRACNYLY